MTKIKEMEMREFYYAKCSSYAINQAFGFIGKVYSLILPISCVIVISVFLIIQLFFRSNDFVVFIISIGLSILVLLTLSSIICSLYFNKLVRERKKIFEDNKIETRRKILFYCNMKNIEKVIKKIREINIKTFEDMYLKELNIDMIDALKEINSNEIRKIRDKISKESNAKIYLFIGGLCLNKFFSFIDYLYRESNEEIFIEKMVFKFILFLSLMALMIGAKYIFDEIEGYMQRKKKQKIMDLEGINSILNNKKIELLKNGKVKKSARLQGVKR